MKIVISVYQKTATLYYEGEPILTLSENDLTEYAILLMRV